MGPARERGKLTKMNTGYKNFLSGKSFSLPTQDQSSFQLNALQWNLSNMDTLGTKKLPGIVRCPYFRQTITWDSAKCPDEPRCPYFRDVL